MVTTIACVCTVTMSVCPWLQDMVSEWESYEVTADKLRQELRAAEVLLGPSEVVKVSADKLKEHLKEAKAVESTVETCHSDLAAMEKAADAVMDHLPATGDARVTIQEELKDLKEKVKL